MQHKKMISALMAGLLVFMMAGCGSVPSDSEIKKALEDGTIHYASNGIKIHQRWRSLFGMEQRLQRQWTSGRSGGIVQ